MDTFSAPCVMATKCTTLALESRTVKQELEGIVVSCEIHFIYVSYLTNWFLILSTVIADFSPPECRTFEDPAYCEKSQEKT